EMDYRALIREHGTKIGVAVATSIATGLAALLVPSIRGGLVAAFAWTMQPIVTDRWVVILLGLIAISSLAVLWREARVRVPRHTNDNDALAVLISWMGHRDSSLNTQVMYYAHVDRQLRLVPGTAKRL